jgi:glutathione peroxidase
MGALFFKSGSDKLAKQQKNFWELEARDIDGNLVKFSSLKGGKAFLIVNVACKCGLTSDHYKQLVDLHKKYE